MRYEDCLHESIANIQGKTLLQKELSSTLLYLNSEVGWLCCSAEPQLHTIEGALNKHSRNEVRVRKKGKKRQGRCCPSRIFGTTDTPSSGRPVARRCSSKIAAATRRSARKRSQSAAMSVLG